MPRKILSQASSSYGRQADRHEQSKEMGQVQAATRAKSSKLLAMGKTRKPRASPPG